MDNDVIGFLGVEWLICLFWKFVRIVGYLILFSNILSVCVEYIEIELLFSNVLNNENRLGNRVKIVLEKKNIVDVREILVCYYI